ncbi:MAG: P1 family peptidase [Bryobacteraceae bacterium]
MKGLTDIPGIRVGHASDFEAMTGCTVILCESGAVAGADIRGSATGVEEFDLMNPLHLTSRIHAVVLAGGSAFGLESASGVRRYLEQKGIGYGTGAARVPLVPCCILYDLGIGKPNIRPTREMGEAAAAAATSEAVREGAVGAGTGATVGKVLGLRHAMKGGIGSATVTLEGPYDGVLVSALAAVNAFGDVRDPETGRILAGTRTAPDSTAFADSERLLLAGARGGFAPQNTTLAVVATNARLDKVQATKLAQLSQIGLTRAVAPAHTMYDGDIVIALSLGEREADITALGIAGARAVADSIVRAVRGAASLGGVPGLAK